MKGRAYLISGFAAAALAGGFFLPRPTPPADTPPTVTASTMPAPTAPPTPGPTSLREVAHTLQRDLESADATIADANREIAEQTRLVAALESLEARFNERRISADEYVRERKAIAERALARAPRESAGE